MPANKAQRNSISTETVSLNQDAQDSFTKERTAVLDPQVKAKKQYSPRRSFYTAYKVRILAAYDACDSAAQRVALRKRFMKYSIPAIRVYSKNKLPNILLRQLMFFHNCW